MTRRPSAVALLTVVALASAPAAATSREQGPAPASVDSVWAATERYRQALPPWADTSGIGRLRRAAGEVTGAGAAGSVGAAVAVAAELDDHTLGPPGAAASGTSRPWLEALRDAVRTARSAAARSAALSGARRLEAVVDPRVDAAPAGRAARRMRTLTQAATKPLHDGAAALAAAVDRVLPTLAAVAALQPPSDAAAGCDLVDQLPRLCVGGIGDNTYKQDAELLVDLGGNDVYRNSAGGADPDHNGLSVSLAIDVAGDDDYVAALPLPSGARVAQGAGTAGGIGMLVDAAGADRYSVSATGAIEVGSLGAVGQGSSVVGHGTLVDLAGDDAYDVRTTGVAALLLSAVPDTPPLQANPHGVPVGAFGNGVTLGGAAVFVDSTGTDSYRVRATPKDVMDGPAGSLLGGFAFGAGFGMGSFGVGMFVDGAGDDSMRLEALDRVEASDPQAPDAAVAGFGVGLAGVGVAALGPGATKAAAVADTTRPSPAFDPDWPSSSSASVFGVGISAVVPPAAGMFVDAGGSDAYSAAARVTNKSDDSVTSVAAMGVGSGGASGMMQDAGGDDRYKVESIATSKRDADGLSYAQGAGITAGAGLLVDAAGDDLYSSTARGASDLRRLLTRSVAQAAAADFGLGALIDGGGADRYETSNLYRLLGTWRPTVSEVQASVVSGAALFVDADAGDPDEFESVPQDRACEGTRGTGSWKDCGAYEGRGYILEP